MQPIERRRITQEVLELGQSLFDSLIEEALSRPKTQDGESYPEAEARAAAGKFFTALRYLLEVEPDGRS